MAVQEHVDMLQQGVTSWNIWRGNNPTTRPDLRGANLAGANLAGANLAGVDLVDADLVDADLVGASLEGANCGRANLYRANLSETNLYRANFFEANLSEANLYKADLKRVDLVATALNNTNFHEAYMGLTHFAYTDLRKAKGLETVRHAGPSSVSISILPLLPGDIPEVFLRGVGLNDTLIEYARSLFHKPVEYYTCFISYSSRDELFARRLHNDLQQEGIRCWFAPEDMDIGDKIKHRIDESIRMYDKLLLILSEHSIASSWVQYEVERALTKEPKGKPNVLYPVRVDKTILTCRKQWAKDIKSTRHVGDFENWTDPQHYEENFKRLLRALNTKKKQLKD